jgi:hypothetical protein
VTGLPVSTGTMADIRADKDASRDEADPKKGLTDTNFGTGFETKAFEALERDFQEVCSKRENDSGRLN